MRRMKKTAGGVTCGDDSPAMWCWQKSAAGVLLNRHGLVTVLLESDGVVIKEMSLETLGN